MSLAIALLATALIASPSAAASHACAGDALERAKPLLVLHFGEDSRISIAPAVKVLPSISNPASPKQRFDVLEVWGTIYKGQYRMRFIYAQSPDDCVLMGQEILEYAGL